LDVGAARIARAPDERPASPLPGDERLLAERACFAGRHRLALLPVLDVRAVREPRAADELAELSLAHDEASDLAFRAFLARLAGRDPHALHRPLGTLERFGERLVPLAHRGLVLASALLDGIEPLLEVGREGDVDDVRKVLTQHRVDGLAELGRMQPAFDLFHVLAFLDDLDGRG